VAALVTTASTTTPTTTVDRPTPPVSAIADVLALWGRDGWLTPPLAPVVAAPRPTLGRVQTITVQVGPTGPGLAPIYDVLSGDLEGRFVVIAGAGPLPGSMFGEILARSAQQRGALGVLIDGNVRDVPDLTTIGLPVYGAGRCVVGPNALAHIVAVSEPVDIGGVTIATDDHIVVDGSGCVRIGSHDLDAVLDAAASYAAAEDRVVAALRDGATLATAYHHKKSAVGELSRLAPPSTERASTQRGGDDTGSPYQPT
jgi:4-hydroxy-4-methyl-2-oxoglutarate aldolase